MVFYELSENTDVDVLIDATDTIGLAFYDKSNGSRMRYAVAILDANEVKNLIRALEITSTVVY